LHVEGYAHDVGVENLSVLALKKEEDVLEVFLILQPSAAFNLDYELLLELGKETLLHLLLLLCLPFI